MEQSYGIGITNRYSCFLENDDDPSESLKLAEADNKKKEVTTAPSTAPSQAQRKGIRDSNTKGGTTNEAQQRTNRYPGPGDRGGNRVPRPERQNAENVDRRPPRPAGDDREERNNRRNQDDAREYRGEGGEYSGNGGGARRGGFPRGGSRGGAPFGRGRGPFRKREFDRQSGSDKSGVKPVDKRDGAGSRNWGTYKDDDLVEGTNPISPDESMEEKPDATLVDGEQGENEKTAEGEGDAPAEGEEEPKSMTLAEWKALQEQQARPKPVFNLRKAGEGEDQSQWKKMTLKTKEKENRDEEEEEEEEYSGEFPQRAGRQKQLLDIDFHFPDTRRGMAPSGVGFSGPPRGDMKNRPRRPDSDRGGRGGGSPRGFGGRGGFRGGRGFSNRDDRPTRQMAPKVDDERDFPSLG